MPWRERFCLALVLTLPLGVYPLSWLPFSLAQFRFSIALPVAAAALCVLFVLFAVRSLSDPLPMAFPRPLLGPMLGVLASALLSVRFSQHPYFSVGALPVVLGNLAIFLLATGVSPEALPTLAGCWLAAAVVVAVVGIARGGTGPDFVSVIGNRNFVGAYLAASVCIGRALWLRLAGVEQHRRVALNGLFFTALTLLVAALCLCRSRGAWLALAMVAVAGLWVKAGIRRPLKLAVIGAAILVAVVWGQSYVGRQWRTDVRPMIWKGTVAMIRARPLLGHGLGVFRVDYAAFRPPEYFSRPKAANLTDHAHNELLETAAEQGLLGLAATLWLWVAVVVMAIRAWRRDEDQALPIVRWGFMAAAAVFVLHGMVDVDLRHPPNQTLVWLVLGLIVSGAPSGPAQFAVRSGLARGVLAVACLGAAAVVAFTAVVEPVRADWWERQARVAQSRGDVPAALTAAGQALAIDPLRLDTHYFLAGILAQSPTAASRREAIQECLRIEALAPDYSDITYNLGQLYLAEGQPGQALPCLQRAAQQNPYDADKRIMLGHALAALGQETAARKQWEAAAQIRPDDPAIKALLSRDQPTTTP